MSAKLTSRIYSPIAVLMVIIASSVASSATWFMFYQPYEPVCLRRSN